MTEKIILGIDPGTNLMGYGLLKVVDKKAQMLTNPKHLVIESAHPSPLSAYRGFFGSRPFSKCNDYLKSNGITPIDWQIRD